MPKYSEIPSVETAFHRWVHEEDPPADLYPAALSFPDLKARIEALDPDVKVVQTVHETLAHSTLVLAAKATRLLEPAAAAAADLAYAQVNVLLSRFAKLGLVEWEWKLRSAGPVDDPRRGEEPPGAGERARSLEAKVRELVAAAGVELVPPGEARRVVRVSDDPLYEGEYYEIQVFEVLFGMGYPERQR